MSPDTPAPDTPASDPRPSREQVIGRGLSWTAAWSGRLVLVVAGLVVAGLVVRETWGILLPIVLALIVTTVLRRLADLLRRSCPDALAAGLSLLLGIAVVAGTLLLLVPVVSAQSDDLVSAFTEGLQRLQDWVQGSSFISKDQVDSALQGLQDKVQGSPGEIASAVLAGVGVVTGTATTVVVTLILTFLFLKDGPRFRPWLRGIAGERAGHHLDEVARGTWRSLAGFIRAQALTSLVDAVLIGIGLVVVGVPLAVPLAVLTFVGGFVPIVGAFVVGAVAVLVALVTNGLTSALVVLAVIVVVQQLEGNVLSPLLQSRSVNLHPAVVLLSVVLGSGLFGVTGAFLAVPAVAVAAVVLRYLLDQADRASAPAAEPPAD